MTQMKYSHLFMSRLEWELICSELCSGPNIYSQSLSTLSGDIETPFNLTTTGHQLLLRWSSDHGTNRRGFHIRYVGEYQSMYPIYNHILLLLKMKMSRFGARFTKPGKFAGDCEPYVFTDMGVISKTVPINQPALD